MIKKRNSLINNLSYAFLAQLISLILSVIMSLLVPKMLGVIEFSYWQLFIFYSSYSGLSHFGLIDGIYLTLGGKDKKELNYEELKSQFIILLIQQLVCFLIINIIFIFSNISLERKFIIFASLFFMVIYNLSLFLGYIYQATNRTKLFSISVIIDKIFFIFSIFLLLIKEVNTFQIFIIAYLFSKVLSLIYCIYNGKEIFEVKICKLNKSVKLANKNIKIGINLMIANLASQLVLGIGRFFIDKNWGIEEFGKVSFSIQLTQFFLLFISQISMVLFPVLKNVGNDKLKVIYVKARNILSIILPAIYIAYYPIKNILSSWLPQYSDSLNYLIFMLPICIFDGKFQLLCNTYLKVTRKEKLLLKINIVTMSFSAVMTWLSILIFNNMIITSVMMVASIIFRSIISEIIINKFIKEKKYIDLINEIIITFIFVFFMWKYDNWYTYIGIVLSYFIYLYVNKSKIRSSIIYIKVNEGD